MRNQTDTIRLLVFDLDGTLLPRDKALTARTLRALERCRGRGMLLAFATGRCYESAKPFIDQLSPDAAALSYGAHVMVRGETVFRRLMSPRVATAALRMVGAATRVRAHTEHDVWLSDPAALGCDPLDRAAAFTDRVEHLCAWDIPEATARAIPAACGCALTQLCDSRWCNFSARGTGKGPGVKRIMRLLGVSRGEGVGFGDESCDIAFFRALGCGVCTRNGDAQTLAACDHVTCDCGDDGVAVWLENHILDV